MIKQTPLERLKFFLSFIHPHKKRFLVAFSGGVDSTVLLECCIALKAVYDFQLDVVHIDHRWHETSTEEAAALQATYQCQVTHFFLYTLEKPSEESNLEDISRQKRYAIFEELHRHYVYDGIFLGHHADDRAETVLKRILEGGGLLDIDVMPEKSQWGSLTVYRPWISLSKQALLSYATEHHWDFIRDPTNQDTRFLRGKMREKMIPYLKEIFGKNIMESLNYKADQAKKMQQALAKLYHYYGWKVIVTAFGAELCFNGTQEIDPFEVGCFMKQVFKEQGVVASRFQVDVLSSLIAEKKSNKQLMIQGRLFLIDRGKVFWNFKKNILSVLQPKHNEIISPEELFEAKVLNYDSRYLDYMGWQSLWEQGISYCPVDAIDEYSLSFLKAPYLSCPIGRRLKKKYVEKKIPSFLIHLVPILLGSKKEMVGEFLLDSVTQAKVLGVKNPPYLVRIQYKKSV